MLKVMSVVNVTKIKIELSTQFKMFNLQPNRAVTDPKYKSIHSLVLDADLVKHDFVSCLPRNRDSVEGSKTAQLIAEIIDILSGSGN